MRRRSVRSGAPIFHECESTTYTDVFCGSSMRPLHDAETTVAFRLHGSDKAIERWPERTEALCWHCRHGFEGVPASIPMACDDGVWQMKGIFCSWSCAKRFVLDENPFNVSSVLFAMKKVSSELFGVQGIIVAAPPLSALVAFGGHMDIESFRRGSQRALVTCQYPFFNYGMGITDRGNNNATGESSSRQKSMYKTFLEEKKRKPSEKKRKKKQTTITGSMGNFMKKKKRTAR